jgi:hypothetical protein
MSNLSARERQWLMQHQELVSTPAGQSRLQTAYYDTKVSNDQKAPAVSTSAVSTQY